MPNNDMEVLREETLEHLENFPKVLNQHKELVQKLGERFKTKKAWKPMKFLETWRTQDGLEKFYFLGWTRAAIKKMGVAGAMRYLNLQEKKEIDFELVAILNGATKEELDAFREGEDTIPS